MIIGLVSSPTEKKGKSTNAEKEVTKDEKMSTITLSRLEVPALEWPIDDGFTF